VSTVRPRCAILNTGWAVGGLPFISNREVVLAGVLCQWLTMGRGFSPTPLTILTATVDRIVVYPARSSVGARVVGLIVLPPDILARGVDPLTGHRLAVGVARTAHAPNRAMVSVLAISYVVV